MLGIESTSPYEQTRVLGLCRLGSQVYERRLQTVKCYHYVGNQNSSQSWLERDLSFFVTCAWRPPISLASVGQSLNHHCIICICTQDSTQIKLLCKRLWFIASIGKLVNSLARKFIYLFNIIFRIENEYHIKF